MSRALIPLSVGNLSLMHHLGRVSRQISIILLQLLSLLLLDLSVDLECCHYFVTNAIVVERQGKVSLDLDSLSFFDELSPSDETLSLKTKESEDSCLGLLLSFELLLFNHTLKVEEPSPLNHESLNLLRLLGLISGCSIESQRIEALSLQSQVESKSTNLLVGSLVFLPSGIEKKLLECLEF